MTQTRAILPADLRAFYAEARQATYAASSPPAEKPAIPRSKELCYEAGPYCYVDRYVDDPAVRPGNFFGLEVVSREGATGPVIASCSYGGGFTAEGLNLPENADLGAVLKQVLHEHTDRVRFGERFRVDVQTEAGLWTYEDLGAVEPWGWRGMELIWLGQVMVYTLGYQGGCLLAGF